MVLFLVSFVWEFCYFNVSLKCLPEVLTNKTLLSIIPNDLINADFE